MSVLQVDPSQKKTVVVLMIVLVAAVSATVIRVSGPQASRAAAPTPDSPAEESCARADFTDDGPIARNPFQQPAGLPAGLGAADRPRAESRPALDPAAFRLLPDMGSQLGAVRVAPMSVPAPGSPVSDTAPATGEQARPGPAFLLLATVRNDNGFTAIISSAESAARVVEVGDTLEGAFVVKRIEAGRAILVRGSEVKIAKRPVE